MVTELSLFSGAGGGLVASNFLGWKVVGYVEKDEYCRSVLRQRIRDGLLNDAPLYSDVRTLDCRPYRGKVDIITAGFPCQPFSIAGKRTGARDKRNMWPDTIRIVNEVRPRLVLLENVPALLGVSHGYFGQILRDLAASGFDARWRVLSAAQVGARHIRARVWILAYANGNKLRHQLGRAESRATAAKLRNDCAQSWWATEPSLGRVSHGVAHRVERLRALGNGIVPQCMVQAWLSLTDLDCLPDCPATRHNAAEVEQVDQDEQVPF